MRITGGFLGGRTLQAPEGMGTRPTTDRVREALFDIIAHRDWGENIGNPLENRLVLDAFAGTGALGIEALSRGAARGFFFENNRLALNALRENCKKLGVMESCSLFPINVLRAPKADQACSLVFLDPPYHKKLIPEAITALDQAGWIAPHALIVAETAKGEELKMPDIFQPLLERRYGDTVLCFFEKTTP